MFTDLPLAEIARLEQLKDAEINVAKEVLATEATRLCHGDEAGREAQPRRPRAHLPAPRLRDCPPIRCRAARRCWSSTSPSRSAWRAPRARRRRLVEQGGVRLNDQPVRTANATITAEDLDASGTARLTIGKKRHALIRAG